jgi:hypothetical protein
VFGHSCGHLQGGALQMTDTLYRDITEVFEPVQGFKTLNFKNNTWLKIHIKTWRRKNQRDVT